MSTSATLPAGFSLTSINGFGRCTAIPRASTTLTGSLATEASSLIQAAAVTVTQSTTQTTGTTTVQATSTIVPAVVLSPASSATSTIASTTSSTTAIVVSTTSAASLSVSQISSFITSASPASKGTTPTTSSTTPIAIAQSEVHSTATASASTYDPSTHDPSTHSTSASVALSTTAAAASDASSASSGISSNPKLEAGPVVGGVFGGIALIGLLSFLLWFFRRQRKNRRESLLTPLTTKRESEFYEIDRGSVGPTGLGSKWSQKLGYQTKRAKDIIPSIKSTLSGLKSKVLPDRSDTPSVNLNRGNSQFLDGPIPQHSRNNSILSNHSQNYTLKERLQNYYERFKDTIHAKRNRRASESADPFASARSMTQNQANTVNPPDFSQLLGMDDRELQLQSERRLASFQTPPTNELGSLGLNFGTSNTNTNPFLDPPKPTVPSSSTYIHQIRHSRGQSVTQNQGGPFQPASRYPSTIISNRDTYIGTTRKTLGRSDPFDLERPELWRPPLLPTNSLLPDPLNPNNATDSGAFGNAAGTNVVQGDRIKSASGESYTSKYSSGMSLDMEWGDPGPDVEPGSVESGSFLNRDGNVSPVSSKGGVGKAK